MQGRDYWATLALDWHAVLPSAVSFDLVLAQLFDPLIVTKENRSGEVTEYTYQGFHRRVHQNSDSILPPPPTRTGQRPAIRFNLRICNYSEQFKKSSGLMAATLVRISWDCSRYGLGD